MNLYDGIVDLFQGFCSLRNFLEEIFRSEYCRNQQRSEIDSTSTDFQKLLFFIYSYKLEVNITER